MKTTIMIMSLGTASLFAAPPFVAGRQVNRQARVAQGVRSGSLTHAVIRNREARLAQHKLSNQIYG